MKEKDEGFLQSLPVVFQSSVLQHFSNRSSDKVDLQEPFDIDQIWPLEADMLRLFGNNWTLVFGIFSGLGVVRESLLWLHELPLLLYTDVPM